MTTAWTRDTDIRARLEKKWARGEFLAMSVGDLPFEPLRLPLKHPTASQLTHQFDEARGWIDHLVRHAGQENKQGFEIEWREINHRALGRNRIPVAITFQTLENIHSYLGKTGAAIRYRALFHDITGRFPELAGLLTEKPLDVLRHGTVWDELLSIVSYLKENPRPMIYIRQLEIPGVDTKFIETHKAFLIRLLEAALPEHAVNKAAGGSSAFENRFGFRPRPGRIRFRILDQALSIMGLTDLQITESDFHSLSITPRTVFITENEINGLAFPPVPDALVIFGLGYSLSALAGARWMNEASLWYWGDIDTHGFAMLDRLRHHFPHARSFLMDEDTLLSHKALWGSEPTPTRRDLPLLTADESRVYDALRNNHHAPSLRLEQERISYTHVKRSIAARL